MKAANDHRITIEGETVHVNAIGALTIDAAAALLRSTTLLGEPRSPKRFLFDCRYSVLLMSMTELQAIAASFARYFTGARIALVLSTTHRSRREAANRVVQAGHDLRVFTNLFDAKDWLSERRAIPRLKPNGRTKAESANETRYAPRTVVDLDVELAYWCARLRCTASQLRVATQAVGLDIKSVEAYISEQRAQRKH